MPTKHVWLYFTPHGPSARVFIACYMIVSGLARIVTGNTAAGNVNVFSARAFGALLVAAGILLFSTVLSRFRLRWPGRLAAIVAAVLWLLLIAQAWPAQAWVSIAGASLYAVFLIYEVSAPGDKVHVDA